MRNSKMETKVLLGSIENTDNTTGTQKAKDFYQIVEEKMEFKSKKTNSNKENNVPRRDAQRKLRAKIQDTSSPSLLNHQIFDGNNIQLKPKKNYKEIKSSVGLQAICKDEPEKCNCISGCENNCINRCAQIECSPYLCALNKKCSNQKIQKFEWKSNLIRFTTDGKGFGIKTNELIKIYEFVLEYVGEIIKKEEFEKRMNTVYKNDVHHYCMYIGDGLVIDAHRQGNIGRFVNHSCDPNCEIQKWSANGVNRMALFTLRNIQAGEELTYDYNFECFNLSESQICLCKSKNCRGFIGKKVRPQKKTHQNRNLILQQRQKLNRANAIFFVHRNMCNLISVPELKNEDKKMANYVFLPRNLSKVRRMGKKRKPFSEEEFKIMLKMYTAPRLMKRHRLMQAEGNSKESKTARLVKVLQMIYKDTVTAQDEQDKYFLSSFLRTNDEQMAIIKTNLFSGVYRIAEQFDNDVKKILENSLQDYGRFSDNGIAAARFERAYNIAKIKYAPRIEKITRPLSFSSKNMKKDEYVVRCICRSCNPKNMMIRCVRCLVWQHCICLRVNPNVEHYMCEKCDPRNVEREILWSDFRNERMSSCNPNKDVNGNDEFNTDEAEYFTLINDDGLQIKLEDAVYVLPDERIINCDTGNRYTLETIKTCISFETDCYIYCVRKLWKNHKGEKMARCCDYIKPSSLSEYQFSRNEVLLRTAVSHDITLNLVVGHCCILSSDMYRKGRHPIGYELRQIYVCDYEVVNKYYRKKLSSKKKSVFTNNYLFKKYDTTPHLERRISIPHGGSDRNEISKSLKIHKQNRPVCEVETGEKRSDVHESETRKSKLNSILKKFQKHDNYPINLEYVFVPNKRIRKKRKLYDESVS